MQVDRSIKLADHPTVRAVRERGGAQGFADATLDADWLRQTCLDAGADDVGFAALDDPLLADERDYVLEALPGTRTLIAICIRANRENMRSVARSIATTELYHVREQVDEVARRIARRLEDRGIRAVNPPMDVPMEAHRFPARMWVVSHKRAAVAAGLGHMGLHRNVIHPRFGSFVGLGTVLTQAAVSTYAQPLQTNPCVDCGLCVEVCPVGAIKPSGDFDFNACATHNNRETYAGFTQWIEQIADATDAEDYSRRVSDAEHAVMWQSLASKPNVHSAYCVAVCPAGDDVLGPYLHDDERFVRETVRPLVNKREDVYVLRDSAAEEHVRTRFPSKVARRVERGRRPSPAPLDPAPLPSEDR